MQNVTSQIDGMAAVRGQEIQYGGGCAQKSRQKSAVYVKKSVNIHDQNDPFRIFLEQKRAQRSAARLNNGNPDSRFVSR